MDRFKNTEKGLASFVIDELSTISNNHDLIERINKKHFIIKQRAFISLIMKVLERTEQLRNSKEDFRFVRTFREHVIHTGLDVTQAKVLRKVVTNYYLRNCFKEDNRVWHAIPIKKTSNKNFKFLKENESIGPFGEVFRSNLLALIHNPVQDYPVEYKEWVEYIKDYEVPSNINFKYILI